MNSDELTSWGITINVNLSLYVTIEYYMLPSECCVTIQIPQMLPSKYADL